MNDMFFTKLLQNAKQWDFETKKSLIFANISFEVNGKLTSGDYEYKFANSMTLDENTKKAINKEIDNSFKKIDEGNCFSFYKYLKDKKFRYARLFISGDHHPEDFCRFSSSLETDINKEEKDIDKARDRIVVIKQDNVDRIKQNDIPLRTIIEEYNNYFEVLRKDKSHNITEVYFYLVRPSIDYNKLNGMLYFCSCKEVQIEALKELALLLTNRLVGMLFDKMENEEKYAAKAAIISRNLSHNLGSHVMFYIKQKLESVSSILKEGTLEKLIQAKSYDELKNQLNQQKLDNEMPFLVGLGRFINYLQERQDYIATVATDHIPYRSIINFKDSIFDELKPEKRAERHKREKGTKDRKAGNLLLDYIAYSEGFTSSDKIELKFRKDGVANIDYKNNDNYFDGSGLPSDVPMGLRNFNISLPGGNLGRQAFFSIMENIIRNTAKHEKSLCDDCKKLTFLFDKLDAKDITDVFGYSWRDRESLKRNQSNNISSSYQKYNNELYYLGITVKLEKSKEEINNTLRKICDGLHEEYLIDGIRNENSKGLKEIRISAAWLRGKNMDYEISSNLNEPPAVAIRKTDEGYLQYIICLPKPKMVAFISCNGERLPLDEYGCQLFDIKYFEQEKYQIADFDLIVCNDSEYSKIKPFIGARVLKDDFYWEQVCEDKDKQKKDNSYIKKYIEIRNNYKKWRNDISEKEPKLQSSNDAFEVEALKKTLNEISQLIEETETNFVEGLYFQWLEQDFSKFHDVKLSILDSKVPKEIKNSKDKSISSYVSNGTADDTDSVLYSNAIVFNTHYEGQAKTKNRNLFAKARFVESVSGGNSTDRLIRRGKWDIHWYCWHKVAGLTQIAVFDERLYDYIMPSEGYEPVQIKDIENRVFSQEIKDVKSVFDSSIKLLKLNDKQISTLEESLKNKEYLEKKDYRHYLPIKIRDYSHTWQYREKGIWVFNIRTTFSIDRTKYNDIKIVGYNAVPTHNGIGLYNENYCEETIANIKKENNLITVDWSNNHNRAFKNEFDFISVHQGLLDKIYDVWGISEDLEKIAVTNALHDAFSSKALKEKSSNENGYLPQFIIHSGRSKPNKKDMPQHLPFLQFSAIDYALRDCKYLLTDLFYSAHYEE